MSDDVHLPDEIVDWIADAAGGRVLACDRRPGGARKEAWFVDVERPGADPVADPGAGTTELFLRFDRSDPALTGDPWTLHRREEENAAPTHALHLGRGLNAVGSDNGIGVPLEKDVRFGR